MKNYLDAKVGINVLNEHGETTPRFFEQLFFTTHKQWLHQITPLIQLEQLEARWQSLDKRIAIKELPVAGQWVRCVVHKTRNIDHEVELQSLIFDEQGQTLAWQTTHWALVSRLDQPETLPILTFPHVDPPQGFPYNIGEMEQALIHQSL
jgi:hypothetical protein